MCSPQRLAGDFRVDRGVDSLSFAIPAQFVPDVCVPSCLLIPSATASSLSRVDSIPGANLAESRCVVGQSFLGCLIDPLQRRTRL